MVAMVGLATAGCSEQAAAPERPALEVRTVMKTKINPATMAIWDVGNAAIGDDGLLDPAQLKPADWLAIADGAGKLGAAARELAAADKLASAAPADSATGEGEVTMATVQKHLDADPAGFRKHANDLAAYADRLSAAASAHDGKTAADLIGGLDAACESCHKAFWDPGPQ